MLHSALGGAQSHDTQRSFLDDVTAWGLRKSFCVMPRPKLGLAASTI